MALNDQQYLLLTLIEQEFSISGQFISRDVARERIGGNPDECPGYFFDSCMIDPEFNKALDNRGIVRPKFKTQAIVPGSPAAVAELTEVDPAMGIVSVKQMAVLNCMLDRNDTRSDKKKLADMQVATQTWQYWQRDPVFANYYHKRAEALFGDMLNEAPRALQDNINRGDLASIKLVYEMTGRYSDKVQSELPIDFILLKVLEVLQKFITDPLKLEEAAGELLIFSKGNSGVSNNARPRSVSGSVSGSSRHLGVLEPASVGDLIQDIGVNVSEHRYAPELIKESNPTKNTLRDL